VAKKKIRGGQDERTLDKKGDKIHGRVRYRNILSGDGLGKKDKSDKTSRGVGRERGDSTNGLQLKKKKWKKEKMKDIPCIGKGAARIQACCKENLILRQKVGKWNRSKSKRPAKREKLGKKCDGPQAKNRLRVTKEGIFGTVRERESSCPEMES